MTINRTPEQDDIEKKIIAINEAHSVEGTEAVHGFVYHDMYIGIPTSSECGRFDVVPEEHYGDHYIAWYGSLNPSMIESTNMESGGVSVDDNFTPNNDKILK